jgi:transcriptional regulator with XRE-family HTH domain
MPDTMGKRLKIAMMEQDLRQVDVIEQLRSYGIHVSRSQLSKVLNDEITTPNLEFIRAIKKILGLSMDYIIDGTEPEAKQERFVSEEANVIGEIADQLPPHMRQSLLEVARLHQRMHAEQRRKDEEIARLLMERVNLLDDLQADADSARRPVPSSSRSAHAVR